MSYYLQDGNDVVLVINLINRLVEENEQLKEENEQLKKARDESDKFIAKKGLRVEFLNWRVAMNEKRCIITSMKKGLKENPTTKKYLDKMIAIDEDTALNIMIHSWLNHKRWNDE